MLTSRGQLDLAVKSVAEKIGAELVSSVVA
jgi:hypothetical protein